VIHHFTAALDRGQRPFVVSSASEYDAGDVARVDADRVLKTVQGIVQVVRRDSFGYQLFCDLAKARHDSPAPLAYSTRLEFSSEPSLRPGYARIKLLDFTVRVAGGAF
jgi:hypothetical protein